MVQIRKTFFLTLFSSFYTDPNKAKKNYSKISNSWREIQGLFKKRCIGVMICLYIGRGVEPRENIRKVLHSAFRVQKKKVENQGYFNSTTTDRSEAGLTLNIRPKRAETTPVIYFEKKKSKKVNTFKFWSTKLNKSGEGLECNICVQAYHTTHYQNFMDGSFICKWPYIPMQNRIPDVLKLNFSGSDGWHVEVRHM